MEGDGRIWKEQQARAWVAVARGSVGEEELAGHVAELREVDDALAFRLVGFVHHDGVVTRRVIVNVLSPLEVEGVRRRWKA